MFNVLVLMFKCAAYALQMACLRIVNGQLFINNAKVRRKL